MQGGQPEDREVLAQDDSSFFRRGGRLFLPFAIRILKFSHEYVTSNLV
jgi:hypothetical protein